MQKETLTLATLGKLDDGTVGAVVDDAITQALKDCEERPGLDGVRKLTIEVAFKPVLDSRSFALKGVDIATKFKLAVPPQTARDQYLQTSVDTSKGVVEALMPESFQESMFASEGKGNRWMGMQSEQ